MNRLIHTSLVCCATLLFSGLPGPGAAVADEPDRARERDRDRAHLVAKLRLRVVAAQITPGPAGERPAVTRLRGRGAGVADRTQARLRLGELNEINGDSTASIELSGPLTFQPRRRVYLGRGTATTVIDGVEHRFQVVVAARLHVRDGRVRLHGRFHSVHPDHAARQNDDTGERPDIAPAPRFRGAIRGVGRLDVVDPPAVE